jgi:hypothetical protein
MEQLQKLCKKCQQNLSSDSFYKRRKNGKLHPCCKKCTYENYKEYFAKNREKIIERNEKRTKILYNKNRKLIFEYLLDHPCVDCGLICPPVMEFDHKSEKKHDVSYAMAKKTQKWWKIGWEEMEKCEVRCTNCHLKKTQKEMNSITYKISLELGY